MMVSCFFCVCSGWVYWIIVGMASFHFFGVKWGLSLCFCLVLLQMCEECGVMLSSKSGVCVKWKFHFLCSVKIVAGLGVNSQPWKWNLKGSKNVIIVVCEGFCPGENFLFVVQAVRLNRFLDLWLICLVSRYRESEDGCYVFFVIIVNLRLLFFWTGVHFAIGVIKSWRRIPRRWRALVVGKYP